MAKRKPLWGGTGLDFAMARGTAAPIPAAWSPPKITPAVGAAFSFNPQQSYAEPNWGALIAGEPDYAEAESSVNRQNLADRGNLRDAIRRAVIQSGFSVGQDEDIDPATLAAAQGNQFSTRADIENQLRRGAATSDAELAARGILSSGQFTENRSVLQKGADTSRNQLQNALLNTIASGRNQYASTVADRRMQLRGIKESIAARLAQNPGIWQAQGQQAGPMGAGTAGDFFSPLANASAQQMWSAINSPSVRNANKDIIARGFQDFVNRYGSQFGGGGGGGAPAVAAPPRQQASSNPYPGGIPIGTQSGTGLKWNGRAWVKA